MFHEDVCVCAMQLHVRICAQSENVLRRVYWHEDFESPDMLDDAAARIIRVCTHIWHETIKPIRDVSLLCERPQKRTNQKN